MFGYVVAYTSKLITTQEREAKTELVTQTILHILVLQTLEVVLILQHMRVMYLWMFIYIWFVTESKTSDSQMKKKKRIKMHV